MLIPSPRAWRLLLVTLFCHLVSLTGAQAFPAGADNLQDATTISVQSGQSDPTTLTTFTAESSEPHHGFTQSGPYHSAWWKWTPASPGLCTVDTLATAQLADGLLDTQLSVYYSSNGQLVAVARNESVTDTNLSSATFYAQPGVTYFIAVDCPTDAAGSAVLRLRELVPQDATWIGAVQPSLFASSACGSLTIRTTRNGTFSGKLQMAAKVFPFKGTWGLDGRFHTAFNFPAVQGQPLPLPLDLMIDGAETVGGLQFEVDDGIERFGTSAGRVLIYSKLQPATDAGTYNATVSEKQGITPFMGFGGLRVTVTPMGIAKGVGFMGDGQPVLFASPLITSVLDNVSVAPVHLPLFKGQGYLNGYVYAQRSSAPAEGGLVNAYYRRPANAASNFYTSGFQVPVEGSGLEYEKPAAGQRANGLLDSSGQGLLVVQTAAGEVNGFSASTLLSTVNLFTFPTVGKLVTLKLDSATGFVTGHLTDPQGVGRQLRGLVVKNSTVPTLVRGLAGGRTRTARMVIGPQ